MPKGFGYGEGSTKLSKNPIRIKRAVSMMKKKKKATKKNKFTEALRG